MFWLSLGPNFRAQRTRHDEETDLWR